MEPRDDRGDRIRELRVRLDAMRREIEEYRETTRRFVGGRLVLDEAGQEPDGAGDDDGSPAR